MATATVIAPLTSEALTANTAPEKIADWTEADFRSQVNMFVNSQKAFVQGVTKCTLYAVRTSLMHSNNQPLNFILGNLSEKLRPAWTAWLFNFSPFMLSGGKDASAITLDDGSVVELKSAVKFSAKGADELCKLNEMPLLTRDKGGNVSDPAGMQRLCDFVLGSLRGAPRFDTWKREKAGARGDAPLTADEAKTKYDSATKRLAKLVEQIKASGVYNAKDFPGLEVPHGMDYYVDMLTNADEHDLSDRALVAVRRMRGDITFRDILDLIPNCTKENLSPAEEAVYNAMILAGTQAGIVL